jgi:hypothetical protein
MIVTQDTIMTQLFVIVTKLTMIVTQDATSVTGELQISLMTSSKKTYHSLSSDTTNERFGN